MSAPQRFKIGTLEDMIRAYAALPQDRGELMLKEMADAVRIMAPLVDVLVSPFDPITWINDTKGKATVGLKTEDGAFDLKVKLDLPEAPE